MKVRVRYLTSTTARHQRRHGQTVTGAYPNSKDTMIGVELIATTLTIELDDQPLQPINNFSRLKPPAARVTAVTLPRKPLRSKSTRPRAFLGLMGAIVTRLVHGNRAWLFSRL
jgi:hypothetical protein